MSEKEKNEVNTKEETPKEEVLKTFKKTRKAFLIEYSCAIFLVGLLMVLGFKGITLKPIISRLAYSLAFLAIITAETSRIMIRYKVLPKKLTIIRGIIKHDKKNVYFHPLGFVPYLNVKQTRMQRLLSYGTIYLKGESGNTFAIKDVNNPHKVLEMIENLIQKNR
jgi:hypothetical protein